MHPTNRTRKLLLIWAASVAISARARPAHAQSVPAPADVPSGDADEKERTSLYREGVALAESGRWGEALERFQRVVALRSAPRALIALAAAEEHVGRLVSAKRTYGKARDDARAEHDDAVVSKAEAALAALDPRIPKLALALPAKTVGAEARLDGTLIEVSAQGVEIDPGVYRLVVSAPGRRPFEERLVIAAGQRRDIAVDLGPAGPGESAPLLAEERKADLPAPRAHAGPPLGAWILGGAGLAAAAVGLAVRLQARSVYDDAAKVGDIDRGNAARDRMVVGTIVAAAGLGILAGGGLWWAISPSPPVGGAAVAVSGSF
jgi:hypothetical protein